MERLGGEYQRTDVEVKASTIEGRSKFLELTGQMVPQVYKDLLRPCKMESLPSNTKENRSIAYRWIRFFLLHTKDPSCYLLDVQALGCSRDIRETPVLAYFDLIHKNKTLIEDLTKESQAYWEPSAKKSYAYDSLVADRTINAFIPDWKHLQMKPDAEWICKELSHWAERWNLGADWCMDFALDCLGVLKNEYIDLFHPGDDYLNGNDEFWEFRRNWIDGKAWYEARLEKVKLRKVFSAYEHNRSLPEAVLEKLIFIYSWPNRLKVRDDDDSIHIQRVFFPFGSHSFRAFRKDIEEEFWNKFFAYFSVRWSLCVGKTDEISCEIKRFDKKLNEFIKDTRKTIARVGNVEKTVSLDGDRHFRWFVDYQVKKLGISDISDREGLNYKTILEGIEGIGHLIELPLRARRRPGRPLASKNKGIGSAGRTR